MAKIKVEFESGEAMGVSCAIEEYIRNLRKSKINPNDILAKSIVKTCIVELRTAHTKLKEAMIEKE